MMIITISNVRGLIELKVLVVEDDLSIQKAIRSGLRKFGYAVDVVADGETAIQYTQINAYDAVVLDLSLPIRDGIDVLKEIRKENQEIGVLILSARSEIEDKITGLDHGANDYMAKPFHFKELEARLRALLRRRFVLTNTIIRQGDLRINTALKEVHYQGQLIDFTRKEYGVLEYLMFNKGRVISAEEIIEHVWDSDVDLFSNSLKVHMNAIKKKLGSYNGGQETIRNVRGQGYYIAGVENDKD